MTIRTLALLSLILSLPPSLAAAAEPATPNAGAAAEVRQPNSRT